MDTLRRGVIVFFALAVGFCLAMSYARADDPWANSPNKSWYDAAEATPDAQKKFNIVKCCASAEVVKTKFQQRGESWWYLDRSSSTWREIPSFIIWLDKHPPDNQPTLFVWNGNLTCFFVPDPET